MSEEAKTFLYMSCHWVMAEANTPITVQIQQEFSYHAKLSCYFTAKLTQNIKNRESDADFNFSPELELCNLLSYIDTEKERINISHRD